MFSIYVRSVFFLYFSSSPKCVVTASALAIVYSSIQARFVWKICFSVLFKQQNYFQKYQQVHLRCMRCDNIMLGLKSSNITSRSNLRTSQQKISYKFIKFIAKRGYFPSEKLKNWFVNLFKLWKHVEIQLTPWCFTIRLAS